MKMPKRDYPIGVKFISDTLKCYSNSLLLFLFIVFIKLMYSGITAN